MRFLVVGLMLVLLTSCVTTKLVSYRDPGFATGYEMGKMVFVASELPLEERVFVETKFDAKIIDERLRELSYLNSGVKIIFHDEEAESTVQGAAIAGGTLGGPLLGLGVKVVVTPQLAEHLSLRDTELLGVDAGEALQSETPAVEAGTEGNTALIRVELDLADGLILVGGQDDVDGLDGTLEVLVGLLGVKLQLQESAIQLVHHGSRESF